MTGTTILLILMIVFSFILGWNLSTWLAPVPLSPRFISWSKSLHCSQCGWEKKVIEKPSPLSNGVKVDSKCPYCDSSITATVRPQSIF